MTGLTDLHAQGIAVEGHRPWPRRAVDAAAWASAIDLLQSGGAVLTALWGEADSVHMALAAPDLTNPLLLSLACPEARYPSVAAKHPPAMRLERTIRDLHGLEPEGLPDQRSWLKHDGRYDFLPVEGESLHQIPVGPVHAGVIEPGHFRFTALGESVVRLEERLGYTHKGTEALMRGADLARAAKLAGRVSGDSTVAYAWAFAAAAEAALGIAVPARALHLRALMAELERLANHLGDIGAVCNDCAFALMLAHCGALRERVLRAADAAFGHRLLMDRIVPGGVARDLDENGKTAIRAALDTIAAQFPNLVRIYDGTASLEDRTVGTGTVRASLVQQFGAGGYVGRASGRAVDARKAPGYAPYPLLAFETPVLTAGDVDARVRIRIAEVEQSLKLIEQLLETLPSGPIASALPVQGSVCEGSALIEGFRGDIFVWVRIAADGRVAACHLRDPSWFQWPLLEAAIEGNIVADFPLCNKSFNCSYSGVDL
jgi:Ni,Fe-hydrogenase III large subunit